MYAVKGSWVGQTFALAKSNEAEGRKTRIRRSKEERKQMVESFIKQYQSLNKGNFPSLNLTHKEVGGSFYTVREIVREVIQENRVLGPGKMLPHEENSEQILEYPLGTIATELHTSLSVSPNVSVILDQQQSTIEEPDVVVDEQFVEPELQGLNNGKIFNGSHVSVEGEQSDEPKVVEVLANEVVEAEKNVEKVAASELAKMADVTVETFPMRPVASPTSHLDENSSARENLNGFLSEEEKVHPTAGEDSILPAGMSFWGSREVKNQEGPISETTSDLFDRKAEGDVANSLVVSLNSSAVKDGMVNDVELDMDMNVKPSNNDEECPLGTIPTEPLTSLSVLPNGSASLNQQQSTIEEPDVIVDKLFVEPELKGDDNGKIINGNHVSVEGEQSDEPKVAEVLVNEVVEAEEKVEKVAASEVAKMADVMVETFPIRPVASSTSHLDEDSRALGILNGNMGEEGKVHSTAGEDSILPNGMSFSGSGEVKNQEGPLSDSTLGLLDRKAEDDVVNPLVVSLNSSSVKYGLVNDVALDIEVNVKPSDNDVGIIENKAADPPSDILAKTTNGAHATIVGSNTKSHDEVEAKPNGQQSDCHLKGSNTTLNRISLSRAWDGEYRKPEANPFWAFVKAFVDAFVKFWSE